jgi:hypothetical protein
MSRCITVKDDPPLQRAVRLEELPAQLEVFCLLEFGLEPCDRLSERHVCSHLDLDFQTLRALDDVHEEYDCRSFCFPIGRATDNGLRKVGLVKTLEDVDLLM